MPSVYLRRSPVPSFQITPLHCTAGRRRMSVVLAIAAIVGVSLVAALILTPLARAMARRVGAVTQPSSDRWQKPPTPLFGGVAIFLATVAGLTTASFIVGDGWAVRLIGT